MVNFRKSLGAESGDKKKNPVEIYDLLDRKARWGR
jgi:hypothetical protein